VKGSDVTVRAGDGTPFQAYLTGDTQPARPAVIMFPPIFGVDADARAIADRWADRGYLVAVPDYFFRTAPGVLDRSESGRKLAMQRWKSLDVDRTIADMWCLKSYLLSRPSCNSEFAALGFCAGGELAFLAATRLAAKAVATFHATHVDRHLDEAAKIAGRLTLHYGGNDPLVPMDQVELIRSKLASDQHVDVHVYPGAAHGFSFSSQPSYHQAAATGSDQRAQEVLGALKSAA
jgi:carboxymethylenebutenolidase